MSRIGRLPVAIPAGVEVTVAEGNVVTVKGPKGTLERALPTEMEIKVEDGHVVVSRPNDLKKMKSLHGLTRSLIHNMVVGVSEGYTKELEVNGVGYKAAKQGKKLTLSLGYSHPVEMEDPDGIETKVDGNKIIVSGISKEKVGQFAAEIRDKRRPSTLQKEVRAELENTDDVAAAAHLGTVIGKKAVEAGIESVVFDRGGYIYHGKVKALADAAREAGLKF